MLRLIFVASILFNLTGAVDTYLTKIFTKNQQDGTIASSTGTLIIIGGIVAAIVAIVTYISIGGEVWNLNKLTIMRLVLSGLLYGMAIRPYLEALKVEAIENIIPIRQTIPLFTYLIAHITLGESLSTTGVILIIAIVIILGLFSRNIHTQSINIKGLSLMLICAMGYSISYVTFKVGGGELISSRTAYFRQHVGISLFTIPFLISSPIRKSTALYFKTNGARFSLLNIGNELFYITGMIITNYLNLHYPIAFISTISNGLQAVLGFVMIYIASRIIPKIYKRNYSQKEVVWKISLCIVSCGLLYRFYTISS